MIQEEKEDCKYCNNESALPDYSQSLRISMATTKDIMIAQFLQTQDDKEFDKILNAKYCCQSKKLDTIDEYKKYFPYHGISTQESYVQTILANSKYLEKQFKTLAQDELFLLYEDVDSEFREALSIICRYSKRLQEMADNIQIAYEREKDPVRRKLLDGRGKNKWFKE